MGNPMLKSYHFFFKCFNIIITIFSMFHCLFVLLLLFVEGSPMVKESRGSMPKTQKMVLDAALLNTQHYKVWIKGKVERSGERSSALPYTSV